MDSSPATALGRAVTVFSEIFGDAALAGMFRTGVVEVWQLRTSDKIEAGDDRSEHFVLKDGF